MTLNFIWNIDPQIFSTGPFQFRWLTVSLVVGILLGRQILLMIYKKKGKDPLQASMIYYITLIGAALGARLIYVALSEPSLFLSNPIQAFFPFDFSNGFRFLGTSQFSMIGGLVGIILAVTLYEKFKKSPFTSLLEKGLLLFLVMVVFLRIGNFFQSENYGKPTNEPLGILFASKVERGLLKLPCCVMRIPDGKNPLEKVAIKPGESLAHEGNGYKPIIIYLFFKDSISQQLASEFLIGDVKALLFESSELIYEPGTEPLHYTLFEEGKNKFVARIQTIGIARYPVQLYEGILFLILLIALLWLRFKQGFNPLQISAYLLIIFSGIIFVMAFLIDGKRLSTIPLLTDQIISVPIFLLGVGLLIRAWRMKKRA